MNPFLSFFFFDIFITSNVSIHVLKSFVLWSCPTLCLQLQCPVFTQAPWRSCLEANPAFSCVWLRVCGVGLKCGNLWQGSACLIEGCCRDSKHCYATITDTRRDQDESAWASVSSVAQLATPTNYCFQLTDQGCLCCKQSDVALMRFKCCTVDMQRKSEEKEAGRGE
jgi:hypothetical protein